VERTVADHSPPGRRSYPDKGDGLTMEKHGDGTLPCKTCDITRELSNEAEERVSLGGSLR
jgi:hypothetical protein